MKDPQFTALKDGTLIALAAQTLTANTNGPAFDLAMGASLTAAGGFNPPGGGLPLLMMIPITSYNFASSDETYTFKVQTSPDGTTWTDYSRSASVAGEGVAPGGGLMQIMFSATVRYCRLVLTVAGTSPSIVLGDCFINPQVNTLMG